MNVLTCEKAQPLEVTAPSVNVTIGVLQAAVAVADPSAAVIADEVGLQPRVTKAGVIIMVGALGALSQLTVLVMVAVLPQPSTAVNILVCEEEQLLVDTAPSVNVIVAVLHASVADAEPSAAEIADEVGLQPSGTSAYDPVNAGGIRSLVQVTVLVMVAVLPQASTAVNVLVCDALQLAVDIVPSEEVILVTGPQASLAVALPNAAVISEAAGLHPRVTSLYEPLNTGGARSAVQVTVLVTVAVLPQASIAINVLVCDEVQLAVDIVPSEEVILVTGPQPSVAVAEPRAASISLAVGLQPRVTSL
jgi:hypothetical protein